MIASMIRILLVDDEPAIADVVVYALEENGFRVAAVRDGDQGLQSFRRLQPDLVILDLGLPGLSGLDLFREMRRLRPAVPVVMLTARSEEADRIVGLELGADDYVTKPFSPRELVARVRAVLRRTQPAAPGGHAALRVGPIEMDAERSRVSCFGREMPLSRPEFRLLECLLREPLRTFSRDALIDCIHDGETVVTDRSIDANVKRLRAKFAEVKRGFDPIQTVYGFGYRLGLRQE
jgi:DNA-binding response OmpR family regulator